MFVNLILYVYVGLQAIRLLTAHKYSLPIKSGQSSVHFTRKVNLKIYEGLIKAFFVFDYYVYPPYQNL